MANLAFFLIVTVFSNDIFRYALQSNPQPSIRSYKLPKSIEKAAEILKGNPLAKIVTNTYDFFYWLPRANLLYDVPTVFWRNSTIDYLRWYQFPHNLPPYRYLGDDNEFMKGFFCYGLPGNTLPLGNWDPFGLHLVSEKVVYKYRESEIKHGRLAMLCSLAIIIQESFPVLHPDIGGLAITHMNQLAEKVSLQSNFFTSWIYKIDTNIGDSIAGMSFSVDYFVCLLFLMFFEIRALYSNWTRWLPNEYNHQFDHNIGIGNLKEVCSCVMCFVVEYLNNERSFSLYCLKFKEYENGNYDFDFLKLAPTDAEERREMVEKELNHGRLAMVAVIGMIGQEYLTGYPVVESLKIFIQSSDLF